MNVFAQNGTITGTIADPAGAVVAAAAVEARNMATGAQYQVGSSATGNYVVQLPTGNYELKVSVPGFKQYVRQNIAVPVEQTVRINVALEVGSNTESVTVTETAPLLKTESGELSHNVTADTLNSLPVLGIGSTNVGASGIRSAYSVMNVLPGVSWAPDSRLKVNGNESNTEGIRIEGQDATNGFSRSDTSTNQPSVEAVQEYAIQTSNYSAEFGQAGSGLFNLTMKSGTNQFHGSGYDYFVNEALNAGVPFTNDGKGNLLRPRARRNDYGGSFGGPVWIPKVYNGHDKTFFFFNFEQFRETTITNNVKTTIPTLLMRQGNMSQVLTGRALGKDGIGRTLLENTIYDPTTLRLIDGVPYTDPYPGNIIPVQQLDPVAMKAQTFLPQPSNSGLINNYLPVYSNNRLTSNVSIKLDHSLSSNLKLSGYWSRNGTQSPNNGAFPYPLAAATVDTHSQTTRVNVDYTLTPTMLLHVGVGFVDYVNNPTKQAFDPVAQLGFTGAYAQPSLFPNFTGLSQAQGGFSTGFASGGPLHAINWKPTSTVSLTWVHNNHTFKVGGEVIVNGFWSNGQGFANGSIGFLATETGLPALGGVSRQVTSIGGGSVGYNYASFLIGSPDSGYISVPSVQRLGNHSMAGYIQDNWKVTRKLTLDLGLRYDYQTYLKEHYGYMLNVSFNTPNPSAGGQPGGIIFEGYGGGRCNCEFAHNYPAALGPRLGLAYQLDSKTVLRVGAGISYSPTSNEGSFAGNTGSNKPFSAPSYGITPPFYLRDGLPYKVRFPDFNPGLLPLPGTIGNATNYLDRHAGWPARTIQWSFGLQREITHDLVAEATYVGNRGVWWASYTLSPFSSDAIDIPRLTANGLSLNNPADLALLTSPVNSPLAASRGFGGAPYPGFPTGLSVSQALRPMPEYTMVVNHFNPLGDTWYDALQTKVTKRFSHGLDFVVSYTWSKNLVLGAENNNAYFDPYPTDVFNRGINKQLSSTDQPQALIISGNYTTPKLTVGNGFASKATSAVVRDWTIGAVLRYTSGIPIHVPMSTTNLGSYVFQNAFVNRVPGQSLFTEDLNCHCFDPNTTFVLNPKAWSNPPVGQWGTAATFYNDYRQRRIPAESLSLGRNFRIRERANLQVRAEFTNVFNRTQFNAPTSTNAFATQSTTATGQTTAGFGYINTATTGDPRAGMLVARFQF
jgi:hypothetical protein